MVNNFEEQLQKKALWMSVTAFALILLPRLLRKIFGIIAGRVNFAGQKAGFLAWGNGNRRVLFCSSQYDPDWDRNRAIPLAEKSLLLPAAARLLRKKRR